MENKHAKTVEELAFTSLSSETNAVPLKVVGIIPSWMNGVLVRNGPALFEIGQESFTHWFDGQAMLHSYTFKSGEVTYSNKFLDTSNLRAHRKAGK
jgi:beta,beta-carotene 9',10'-dioxygenase